MSAYFGSGWWIHHLTDREMVLIKEDYLYRKITGRDGFVKVAIQPGDRRRFHIHPECVWFLYNRGELIMANLQNYRWYRDGSVTTNVPRYRVEGQVEGVDPNTGAARDFVVTRKG